MAALEGQPIVFTVAMEDNDIDLSDNQGRTFYTQNGVALPAANAINLKSFTLSAAFGEGGNADIKSAMVGQVYKFKVSGASYTAPVADDPDTDADETVEGNLLTVLFPTSASSAADEVHNPEYDSDNTKPETITNKVDHIDIWVYVQATNNLIVLTSEPTQASLEGATSASSIGKLAVRAHSTSGTPEAELPGKIVVSTPEGYGTNITLQSGD